MSITMTCPQCSARFNFTDDWAGKRARCQRCQNVFTIAAAPPPPAEKPLDVDLNLELIDEPPAKPKSAPAMTLPEPASAAPPPPSARKEAARPAAKAKPARTDTSADDFDVEAFGGFGTSGETEERPSRSRRRRDDEDDEDERPARRRRRSREEDDDEDGPAFSRMQRDRGGD